MASKKKFQVFCNTCASLKEGWSTADTPAEQCPVNPNHSVVSGSLAVCVSTTLLDNLLATTNPTVNDDVNLGYDIGSRWINTITSVTFICTNNSSGAAIWNRQLSGVFGSIVYVGSSLETSSSNSTEWQNKIILDLGTTNAGVYLIGFNYEVKCSKGNYDACVRIIINDTTVVHENVIMPWNSSTGIWASGGVLQTVLTNATHHVDIEYKSSNSQNTVSIQKAQLSIWRIS